MLSNMVANPIKDLKSMLLFKMKPLHIFHYFLQSLKIANLIVDVEHVKLAFVVETTRRTAPLCYEYTVKQCPPLSFIFRVPTTSSSCTPGWKQLT